MYYSDTDARRLIIEAGHMLLEKKMITRTYGNISARISKDEFIITPSAITFDKLAPADLVRVRVSDGSYDGNIKPSSEKGIHAAAYGLRQQTGFIIHTHQFFASVVAAESRDVIPAPCAAYGVPGSSKLSKNAAACIRDNPYNDAFLLARHGALILGSTMEKAFEGVESLEDSCRAMVESRVKAGSDDHAAGFDASKISIKALPYIKVVRDPYIMECCRKGKVVGAYLDDFAQIAGPDIQVVDGEWAAERALLGYSVKAAPKGPMGKMPMTGALDRMGGQQPALNSAIGRNAVLVKGVGAVCAGRTENDAEAIAMIVSKNCAAACYATYAKPLGAIEARMLRYVYLTRYLRKAEA